MRQAFAAVGLIVLGFLAACGGGPVTEVVPSPPVTPPPPVTQPAWSSAFGSDSSGYYADLTVSGNSLIAVQRFRRVAPGTFLMGSPTGEVGRDTDEVQHAVTLTTACWIADSECSQRLWKAVMNTNPAYHQAPAIATTDLDLPVESVSWNDTQTFVTALNAAKPGLFARLPSEAEWESAARAGTTTPFSVAPVDTVNINCYPIAIDPYVASGTYRIQTVKVASLAVNPWAMYGVHGNVGEWVLDLYAADLGTAAVTDPFGPGTGPGRVIRSGNWNAIGQNCRTAERSYLAANQALNTVGFRLAVPAN